MLAIIIVESAILDYTQKVGRINHAWNTFIHLLFQLCKEREYCMAYIYSPIKERLHKKTVNTVWSRVTRNNNNGNVNLAG